MAAAAAKPLQPTDETPQEITGVVEKAADRWLKNTEVADILANYEKYDFRASLEPPVQPSGTIFLFDRKQVRFFRKDGHNWRKKPDGKTVRETHEKLKVENQDVLNCYYAHAEDQSEKFQLQRRCYWLLEGESNMVLVHYLNVPAESIRTRNDREDNHNMGEGALHMQQAHANMGWPAGNPNMHMMYSNHQTAQGVMDPSRGWIQGDGQPARMGHMDSQPGWMGQSRQYSGIDQSQSSLSSNQLLHMQGYSNYGTANPVPQPPMQGYTGEWHQQPARQPTYNYMPPPHMHQYPGNSRPGLPGVDPSIGAPMVSRYPDTQQTSPHLYQNMGQGYQQQTSMQAPSPVMSNWSPSMPDTASSAGISTAHRQGQASGAPQYEYWQGGNASMQAVQPQSTTERPVLVQQLPNYSDAPSIVSQGQQSRQVHDSPVAGTEGQLNATPGSKFPLFHIIDFSPCWDYTSGGSKILVTGTLTGLAPDTTLCVMFGNTEVPAVRLQPGVLRCQAPAHAPGKQRLCVTQGDGTPCSDVVEFQYQLPVKDPPNNLINSITTETSNRELQVRLVTRLLKETGMSVSGGETGSAADVGEGKHRDMVDIAMARVNTLDSNSAERILLLLLERELKIFTQQVIQKHNNGAQLESTAINEVDEDGMGLIHIVSALGYKWAVELLLQAGAYESLQDPWGLTPLHWAAAKGHEDTIALLLRYGAECNSVSYQLGAVGGFTPADLASMNSHNGIAAYLSETHLAQRLSLLQVSDEKCRAQPSRKRQNQIEVATTGSAQEEVQHISAAAREAAEKIFRSRDATADGAEFPPDQGKAPLQERSIAVPAVTATDEEVLGQITKDWMRAGADLSAYGLKQESVNSPSPPGKDAAVNAPELNLAVNRVEAIVHNPHAREQYLRMRDAAERNQVALQVPQVSKSPQLENDR